MEWERKTGNVLKREHREQRNTETSKRDLSSRENTDLKSKPHSDFVQEDSDNLCQPSQPVTVGANLCPLVPVSAEMCQPAPMCISWCQHLPASANFAEVCQSLSTKAMVCQQCQSGLISVNLGWLVQLVSRSAKTNTANTCLSVPTSASWCHPVPRCASKCQPAPNCASQCQYVPVSASQ